MKKQKHSRRFLLYKFDKNSLPKTSMPKLYGIFSTHHPFNLPTTIKLLILFRRDIFIGLFFSFICLIKTRKNSIFYIYRTRGQKIVHVSNSMPSQIHLPWLDENARGIEIGGCMTSNLARGQGIYPHVISQIIMRHKNTMPFYMIVEEQNIASRKGVEKVGFHIACELIKRPSTLGLPEYHPYQ